ncbi:MAG: protein-L-isoaspartate(D-aspartate) O-methyltransferase [Bacteroidales bacterium]|nr:protein-L-isoaspartate(D-aspartate) O-methyltransferase [Bacteroidales bacterium]
MQDTYLHKGKRRNMVQALREKGISDERVLQALNDIPRHFYLDPAMNALAYEDRALPIFCEQTISQPSTVAFQSQLLEVKPNMKVLEIGTGSGYQTAVLCHLGAQVFTIERQKGLYDKTKPFLASQGFRARCYLGDGYKGLADSGYAPFDRIIITCGAPYIPQPLMDQLKMGGIMVIPVGEQQQEMLRIRKTDGEPEIETFGNCRFVPMLQGRQF